MTLLSTWETIALSGDAGLLELNKENNMEYNLSLYVNSKNIGKKLMYNNQSFYICRYKRNIDTSDGMLARFVAKNDKEELIVGRHIKTKNGELFEIDCPIKSGDSIAIHFLI